MLDPVSKRQEIPLFPLGTVLFPGGPLPLRIFEARYIDLVRRCMRENSGFGVVLLTDGPEAGDGPTATSDVGTYARIVDFSGQPDGLLGIEARGERRFRILSRRRARDAGPSCTTRTSTSPRPAGTRRVNACSLATFTGSGRRRKRRLVCSSENAPRGAKTNSARPSAATLRAGARARPDSGPSP